MPVDRPTFSESWYRVAELRPKLRSTVQIHRQHYRGRMWHVLQDPASNQFFRLNEAAYRFVALLDGKHTVAEVWRICQEQLGDGAPTQGEAIQLLGQLYTSNLLQAELPPDAEGLFKRYQKRVRREVQGVMMNLLFIRIPLIDPDNFLDRWVGAISWLFTWFGMLLWLGLTGTGLYFVINNWSDLYNRADAVLNVDNLPFLYLAFIIIKVCHEFGHAFMCKTFGRRTGTGGEVHTMGIMFLVFTPMPYVDASSAWAFRSRRQRILVGMGGMLIELGLAAIAAIIWANVSPGGLRTICYNAMFIASVSTLLFNANPLLRYDGYYILSDILEIPNLAQRSKQYIYYIVRKYVWGVRQARCPAHTGGEKGWFVFYGIASTVYRVFICVRILLFIADKLFLLGAVLAIAAAVAWVLVPLGKFFHYLLTSGELMRVRARAIGTTALALGLIIGGVGFIPAPDRFRIEGVVEPTRVQIVHAATDGFVRETLDSGRVAKPNGTPLVAAVSHDLTAQHEQLLAERRRLVAQRRLAQTEDLASAQILAEKIAALDDRIRSIERQRDRLEIQPAFAGEWVAPNIERSRGAYLRRGDRIGLVASPDVLIRATAQQEVVDLLMRGPTERYKLAIPLVILPPLRRALADANEAGEPLEGVMIDIEHPDKAVPFLVDSIAKPDTPAAATQPTPGPTTQPSAGPATRSSRPEVALAHIRVTDPADTALLPLTGRVLARIGGVEYGQLRIERDVRWRGVEIRMKGQPLPLMTGRVRRIIEAGHERLPSAALGYAVGGAVATDPKDPKGTKAAERFFEIRIDPDPVDNPKSPWHGKMPLLSGQRVVVRVDMPPRPLAQQWYRSLLQLIQRRFKI